MKKSQMARIVEFDRLVRGAYYPSRAGFSVDYGVSARTVARDIEYMRDRLQAPLEYDADRCGYFYSEGWSLPYVVEASVVAEDRVGQLVEQLRALTEEERASVLAAIIPPALQEAAAGAPGGELAA